MDFLKKKKKKNLSHIRSFNKQFFSYQEFLNQDQVNTTHVTGRPVRTAASFQFFIFFLVIIILYSLCNTSYTCILDTFFYDL